MGLLSGWSWYKIISLNGQTGAGTLYQVDLDIGASAGGDFHLEGHCTNFPQDIEVTDNDGTTLLDFWIEDLTADPLKMWVEVADDLGSNQSIWVYYGKSGATTNSNPETTFEFGDDFEDGDTNQWSDEGGSTFVVDSGVKKYGSYSGRHNATTAWAESYATFTSITTDRVVDVWLRKGETDKRSDFLIEKVGGDYNNSIEIYFDTLGNIYLVRDGGNDLLQSYIANTWYHFVITLHAAADYTCDVDIDDVNKITGGGSRGTVPNIAGFGIMNSGDSASDLYVDNLFIRKYVSPEPAFSSAGSEQSAITGNPYWYYNMLKRRN